MNHKVRGIVFDFGNVLYHVDYPAMARRLAGDRADLTAVLRGLAGAADLQDRLAALGLELPRTAGA